MNYQLLLLKNNLFSSPVYSVMYTICMLMCVCVNVVSYPKGGRFFFDVSHLSGISGLSVWSHFSILSPLLFFCLVLPLFLSYLFLLLARYPDLFFPKPPFSEKQALFRGSCLFLFERLENEQFSWWYVQHMLPYSTGITLYALYHIQF